MAENAQFVRAYRLFVEGRSAKAQKSEAEIMAMISREQFLTQLYALYEPYSSGEFSEGYMAELLGIPQIDLIHIKLELGLRG